MDTLIAKIEAQYINQLPFVAYRKPRKTEIQAIFQLDDKLHLTTNYKESGFVFAPFDDQKDVVVLPFENCFKATYTSEDLLDLTSNSICVEAKEVHENLVRKAVNYIQNTTVDKIVLSRIETCALKNDNPISLLKKALHTYPEAFVYLWYHPKVGCWLGATPEVLLTTRNKQFKTMALAGTKMYNNSLNWEAKEREEQQIVTDYIAKKLAAEGVQFTLGKPYTVRAGHLAHIRTDITGSLNITAKTDMQKIISILHPTPAVCGFPKNEAKAFILENESYNRLFYTGFLGELNKENYRKNNRRNTENKAYNFTTTTSDLYVNLRCMQLKDKQAFIYVGGGVTASSDPEKEFLETCNKAKTMKKLIKT